MATTHGGGAAPTSRSGGGGGGPRVRGGGAGSVVQLTASLKAQFQAGRAGKGTSVILANQADWEAYQAGTGPKPASADLLVHQRGDFHADDFRRKALDLNALGDEGVLLKAGEKTQRPGVPHKQPDKFPRKAVPRTVTRIFRERIITRLSKAGTKNPDGTRKDRKVRDPANQQLLNKLYRGRGTPRRAGEALDPDHIHELQLKGMDVHSNLRLMDAYTNRHLGSDIHLALKKVDPETPVKVRLVE
ncbi:hypothetical protein [Actinoplanes couchii]|uniref:HNH endonuclease n=1 Tax=Actinoplanes couchii TaxID=403638 RepID=A0ABQ3XKM7_9ACTN|nr:hypothetical protein [Actinoplanes couchii]MDR6319552.1 hypothetical protein [Actinoplanes couchii]GID59058.1 hypothetical protein Aco03nite_074620 [Actinoplanes couchii]